MVLRYVSSYEKCLNMEKFQGKGYPDKISGESVKSLGLGISYSGKVVKRSMTLPIPTCMLLQWIICKGSSVRENLLPSEPSWLFAKQSCILYFIIHIYMQINWPHQRPFRSQKTNLENDASAKAPTFLPATTKAKWMVYDHLQKITTSNSLFRTLRAWTQTVFLDFRL